MQLKGDELQRAAEVRQQELAKRGLEMSINSIKISLLLETATEEDHKRHAETRNQRNSFMESV